MSAHNVKVVRNPKREEIGLVVGTDAILVQVNYDLDDTEIAKLKAFAVLVAKKCGKDKVIFRGAVERTVTGFSTIISDESGKNVLAIDGRFA